MSEDVPTIVTVTLNPAVDRALEVEELVPGKHQVAREVTRTPGGKGINVSRVIAALGVANIATGLLGADNAGEFGSVFDNHLIRNELFRIPGRTRENVTIVERASSRETHLRDAGLTVPDRDVQRLRSKLDLLSRPGGYVLLCGSLPPGVTCEDFAGIVDLCIERGAKVAVDTSGDALRAMAGRKLWLLKPNVDELGELAGRSPTTPAEISESARQLLDHVECVVITRGSEGADVFTREFSIHASAPVDEQEVVNTVGCGDALLGALVAGIARGVPLRDAFADAVACASATALSSGTARFDDRMYRRLREKVLTTHT
jgi:1-phosphofructokinase family hexose kinase